jgi:tetratricopeptide (TPR) repeat protein
MPYTPMQLAEAFIQAGELTDALDALNQQLETNPGDETARRLRVKVYMRLRGEANFRAALADLDRLANATHDDVIQRSILLEQLLDFEGARTLLSDLHVAQPADERLAERLFFLLLRLKRFAEAHALLAKMPRTWDWLQKAGELATEDGNENQAPGYFSDALADLETRFDTTSDPFARASKAHLLSARAQAYATIQQFAQAEADYAAASAIQPDDPMLVFLRALTLLELGDITQAVTLYRAAYNAANPIYRETMGHIVAQNPRYGVLGEVVNNM